MGPIMLRNRTADNLDRIPKDPVARKPSKKPSTKLEPLPEHIETAIDGFVLSHRECQNRQDMGYTSFLRRFQSLTLKR